MKKKAALFVALFFLFSAVAKAQGKKKDQVWDELFGRNHFSVALMAGASEKATVHADPKRFGLGSSNKLATGINFSYHYHFNKNLSLSTGLHFAIPVTNLKYHVPQQAMNPDPGYAFTSFDHDHYREGYFLIRLPVSLEARWFAGNKKFWQVNAGASLVNYVMNELEIADYHIDQNGQLQRSFYMLLERKVPSSAPWLNYHFGGSRVWMLENRNLLSLGFIVNLSFTKFWAGNFILSPPGITPINGEYSFKGSYIGLTGSYTLTRYFRKRRTINSSRY
jgi:hypothetical protein